MKPVCRALYPQIFLALALLACRAEIGLIPTPSPTSLPPTATPLPSSTATPTPTSTVSPTLLPETPTPTEQAASPTDLWNLYRNYNYDFELRYPPGSNLSLNLPDTARIDLPFESGTNLVEKYLEIHAQEYLGRCLSPLMETLPPEALTLETLVIEPLTFEVAAFSEGAAGSRYEWLAYAVHDEDTCVTLDFVLHSTNPENYATPPPVFDPELEMAVFDQIVQTFVWLAP